MPDHITESESNITDSDAASDSSSAGHAALSNGDWERARTYFEAVLGERETAEAHHGLSEALFWLDELEAALTSRQRAYVGFRRQGDLRRAAREAMTLARYQFLLRGSSAAFNGWMTRADRLLQDVGPCVERGWLEIYWRANSGDPAVVDNAINQALDIARQFDDTDLENLALAYHGLSLVTAGKIEEGMAQLDEAMAATTGGELQHFATLGEIYCTLLAACDRAADLRRAEEWCRIMDAFVSSQHRSPFSAICRTFYGSVLTATGRWQEAEQVFLGVLRVFDDRFHPVARMDAVARYAGLLLRQGRVDEATYLLEGYEEYLEVALPVSMLRYMRGEFSLAEALLQRRLQQLGVELTLEAVPILALLVDVQLSRGDIDAARTTQVQLSALAEASRSVAIVGMADLAAARVSLAESKDPVSHLESALKCFTRADMPLELAQTHLALARSLAQQDLEIAALEANLARAAFERLGMVREADDAAQLLRHLQTGTHNHPKGDSVLTKREHEVLRLISLGLSNEQIAETLFISRRTAEHHVSSILSKLDLTNRAEAAAYAVRSIAPAKSVLD